MKNKQFSRKLVLSKATVSNLTDVQMLIAKGGMPWTSVGIQNNCYTMCDTGVCCPTEYQTRECCAVLVTDGCPPTTIDR